MVEWFEDELFWIEMYPFLFSDKKFQAGEEEVDKILDLVEFKGRFGFVLDLCCGPGRHAIWMAKKGFRVTGVDRTSFLLEKAKEKAEMEEVQVEWVLEDMRIFVRPNIYDLVLNMFTSFGYFNDKREDLTVLKNIYQSLKPSGICLLEMVGKEVLARVFHPISSTNLPDGRMIVRCHDIFDEWSRIRNEWILINNGKANSFRFQHTIYSGQELKDRLFLVGFSQVKLFGDLDGGEYGPNASRLIAVGWK